MQKQSLTISQKLFTGYYAATLVFLAVDVVVGFNIRLSFLEGLPVLRGLYYAACIICFVLIWKRPAWATLIAVCESTLNVSALILDMGFRVMTLTDAAIEGGRPPVTGEEIINFLISGTVAYYGLWVRSRAAAQEFGGRSLTG